MQETIASLRKRLELPGDAVEGFEHDLLQLKKHSRTLHEDSFAAKERICQVLKLQTETAQVALQSAQYEQSYYELELPSCLATPMFDLLFASQTTTETSNNSMQDDEDASAKMQAKLDRVKQELETRRELTREMEALVSELQAANAEVAKWEATLEALPNKARDLENKLNSMQDFLSQN